MIAAEGERVEQELRSASKEASSLLPLYCGFTTALLLLHYCFR